MRRSASEPTPCSARPPPEGGREVAYSRRRDALGRGEEGARGGRVSAGESNPCPKRGERGHSIGPNLASVQRPTPEELLLLIVDPSPQVAPDSLKYAV